MKAPASPVLAAIEAHKAAITAMHAAADANKSPVNESSPAARKWERANNHHFDTFNAVLTINPKSKDEAIALLNYASEETTAGAELDDSVLEAAFRYGKTYKAAKKFSAHIASALRKMK